MGSDIQAYVEYKAEKDQEWTFLANVKLQSDIMLFAMLGIGGTGLEPVVASRGFPKDDVSEEVFLEYSMDVVEEPNSGRDCSTEDAMDLVDKKISKWIDENHNYISRPDFFSPSFITLEELKEAVARKKSIKWEKVKVVQASGVDVDCTIACMEAAEKAGFKTRLVFWFY